MAEIRSERKGVLTWEKELNRGKLNSFSKKEYRRRNKLIQFKKINRAASSVDAKDKGGS